MSETELKITRIGFPPFSARGCEQALSPIEGGLVQRSVNGDFIHLDRSGHHKFKSTIRCDDKAILAFEGFWVGSDVEVCCILRLWQEARVEDQVIQLMRPAVDRSIVVRDRQRQEVPFDHLSASQIKVQGRKETEVQIGFCPKLRMRVTHFSFSTKEWEEKSSWRLDLEEV